MPALASAFSTPALRNQSSERAADASVHGSAMRSMGSVNSLFSSRHSSRLAQPLLPMTSSQFNMLFQRQSSPALLPPIHQAPTQGPAPSTVKAPAVPVQPVQPVLSDEDRCCERDRTHPDVRAIQLNGSTWPSMTKNLSLMGRNWSSWKRVLENVLNINGQLALHVFEAQVWSCPDHDLYLMSAMNWLVNDRAVMGFIKSKVMPEEYTTTDNPNLDTAWKLFNALETRHTRLGAVTQVKMLDKALGVQFTQRTEKNFTDVITKLMELNKEIWAPGPPSKDQFLSIMLLRATQRNFPTLFDSINDSLASGIPPNSEEVIRRIQNFVKSPNHKSSETANVAKVVSATTSSSSSSGCRNCASKGIAITRHQNKYCILEGGGMAGKTIEEARSQRLSDKDAREQKRKKDNMVVTNVAEANLAHLTLNMSPVKSIFRPYCKNNTK
ncbi:hypothetical protein C8J56DRAFT_881639 [Mycena floridula]|nr:hypothetical protein C8J56DRAFT_881639 [Mycena floridula]